MKSEKCVSFANQELLKSEGESLLREIPIIGSWDWDLSIKW